MKIGNRKIDHLVYCVRDLKEAIAQFENEFGISPAIGGRHIHKGTHNAIVNLGNNSYLEILAIDHSNESVKGDRWMGIDLLEESKMTRWALKSIDLKSDVKAIQKINPDLCEISQGQRITPDGKTLKWSMSLPLSKPEVEIIPFFVDWSQSDVYPTDNLSQTCELINVEFSHPKPKEIIDCYEELDFGLDVLENDVVNFKASFIGPKGVFVL